MKTDIISSVEEQNSVLQKRYGLNNARLNIDISTYTFSDLDLAIAVKKLGKRDQKVLILHLMGYSHSDIASLFGLSRSAITKRLSLITKNLALIMGQRSFL